MQNWLFYLKQGLSHKKTKDQISSKVSKPKIEILFPFFLKHWTKAVLGVILVFLSSFALYGIPLVQRFLIDTVILEKKLNLLLWVVLLFVFLQLFSKLTEMLQQFHLKRFGQSVMFDIQTDLLNRVFHFPKAFFDDKETGYLMSRLNNDANELQWFFSGTIIYIITNIIRFCVSVALLFYLEWRLALGVLLVLPLFGFCIYYFSSKVKVLSHHGMEQGANVLKRMQEALSSVSLLKAFVSEKQEVNRITKEITENYKISLQQSAVQSFAQLIIGSLGDISKLIILVAGIPLVVQGNWTAGSLFAFFTYLTYVYNPVQFLANTNFIMQSSLAALERVSAFYDILPEEHGKGITAEKLKGEIIFRDVSFSYNGEDLILQNISFTIFPHEHVAIIGPSGVGKTTLISLLLDFYRPTNGEIFFDGVPAQSYSVDSLRRHIGYVSQNTRLISGTIMDNMLYGNPGVLKEDVEKAAQIADIHNFITTLPKGYFTLLGENGVNLSEGQRQRLSIARALIKDPDILILDEPTSSLDEETEKSIFDILPKAIRNKTMIFVTHRKSTIKAADRIIKLDVN